MSELSGLDIKLRAIPRERLHAIMQGMIMPTRQEESLIREALQPLREEQLKALAKAYAVEVKKKEALTYAKEAKKDRNKRRNLHKKLRKLKV